MQGPGGHPSVHDQTLYLGLSHEVSCYKHNANIQRMAYQPACIHSCTLVVRYRTANSRTGDVAKQQGNSRQPTLGGGSWVTCMAYPALHSRAVTSMRTGSELIMRQSVKEHHQASDAGIAEKQQCSMTGQQD